MIEIAKCTGEKGMTCAPHSAQINLRFGNAAREFLDFRASVRSGHFARECLNFLRQIGVDKNGQAQPVAVRISRRAGSALSGRRARACAHSRDWRLSCPECSRGGFRFV
jgi:hypothetical protein